MLLTFLLKCNIIDLHESIRVVFPKTLHFKSKEQGYHMELKIVREFHGYF